MNEINVKDVLRAAKGNWTRLLVQFGISEKYLSGKHGPCPFCGGKDRWIFQNKNGEGTGYCNQCDAKGNGLIISGKLLNLRGSKCFPELLKVVYNACDGNTRVQNFDKNSDDKKEFLKGKAFQIWNESLPLYEAKESLAVKYLKNRGLDELIIISSELRFHPEVDYYENRKFFAKMPALLGAISNAHGEFIGIHRTYLVIPHDKADIENPKSILGSCKGGSVHFGPPRYRLHIAEGIETALAVTQMIDDSVWAALSASNLSNFIAPEEVKEVVIWVDLDLNGVGVDAAKKLGAQLYTQGIKTYLKEPAGPVKKGKTSFDWLDELNKVQIEDGYVFR